MNIFFLNKNPHIAAHMQCDKHVVKMVLETTQMLCTAAIRNGRNAPYKVAYPKHPMTMWVGDTKDNYMWAYEHALALAKEYTQRYGKIHKCEKIIKDLGPVAGNYNKITEPPLCMPDEFKIHDDITKCYKTYYVHKLASWKTPPRWRLSEPENIMDIEQYV
tara:strand:- start:677 stop:1159 length:483 start_codon:yes stop_codon:yes gene_type:complete